MLNAKVRTHLNDVSTNFRADTEYGSGTSVSDPYLLFVPSLLKPTFKRYGLNTVSDLLSLQPSDFESRKGWGKRKTKLLIALQHLYRTLVHRGVSHRPYR